MMSALAKLYLAGDIVSQGAGITPLPFDLNENPRYHKVLARIKAYGGISQYIMEGDVYIQILFTIWSDLFLKISSVKSYKIIIDVQMKTSTNSTIPKTGIFHVCLKMMGFS